MSKKPEKTGKNLKTIAVQLYRDLRSKLKADHLALYEEILSIFSKKLIKRRESKNKVYSLHEPCISCIAKGKAYKPYEFGNKIGVATLPGSNVIVGIASFSGNPQDSATLLPTLAYAERMSEKQFKYVVTDRSTQELKAWERLGRSRIIL